MQLATRHTTLCSGKASIPVLEVRRLTRTGHQTAIITTARALSSPVLAGRMFSRWCQENFIDSLPKDQRPQELLPISKMLTDTVKMIAYRAETGLEMVFELT
jgi:hypothetical protein